MLLYSAGNWNFSDVTMGNITIDNRAVFIRKSPVQRLVIVSL